MSAYFNGQRAMKLWSCGHFSFCFVLKGLKNVAGTFLYFVQSSFELVYTNSHSYDLIAFTQMVIEYSLEKYYDPEKYMTDP